MRTTQLALTLAAAACVLAGGPVSAHEQKEGEHHHGKADGDDHAPKHGGQFVEDANHHGIEMVVTDAALVFHISEHHEPLDLEGSSFKVVVQSEAGTKLLAASTEGSTVKIGLDAPLAKGAKVVLTGKDGHGDTIQARFVVN